MLTTNAVLGVIKTNSMDASRFITLTTTQVTAAASKPPDQEQNTQAHNWREIKGCQRSLVSCVCKPDQNEGFILLCFFGDQMDGPECVGHWRELRKKPKLFNDYQLALPSVNMMSADTASVIMASISLITLN